MIPSDLRTTLRRNSRRLDRLTTAAAATPRARPAFGLRWARAYLPHYFPGPPADFHAELFERLSDLHTRRDSKEAVIAPREGAKSTVITLAYVLFCALERHEPFALVLSDSAGQAQEQLRHVRHELETNAALARDYPDAAGVGPVWRQDRIELRNGAAVAALGTGGRIRGRRSRQARPSLVVFDDVENNDTITSPVKRERAWRWATREVMPAGTAGTNFLSVGSAIHREAVAVRLGQLPGWTGRTYQAVSRWPDRMDLWGEWERLATNLANPDRGATAARFYDANRGAMDAGAATYWPSRWPLQALMRRRAEIGAAAFDTEYQGVPSAEGLTEFPAAFFDGPDVWFDDWPANLVCRVQALDPSKGADARTGDYQAHVLVGLDTRGTLYAEAVLAREPIPLMIARSLDMADAFGPLDVLVVEDNDALGLLVSAFEDVIRTRGRVVPLRSVTNTLPKVVRIRRLGLYFARGQVRFRNTRGTRALVNQLRDFPVAAHDDGPDALDLAVRMLELLATPSRRG